MPGQKLPFPDRDTVAAKIQALDEEAQAFLTLLLENPAQDDSLLDGLASFLDRQSEARFLNSLKLERTGEWFGATAPARLQIRLAEISKSSQHPAYAAFRKGVEKSGGLERAYPKAPL